MDWNKTKTIFIIVFLILDSFLLYQFLKKHSTNQYEVIADLSFEEKLKVDGIEYVELPKDSIQDQYMSAKSKIFTEEEVNKLSKQKVKVTEETFLESELDEPLEIKNDFDPIQIDNFIKDHVINGEQYRFWEYNEEEQLITYYQEYKGRPFFKNLSGHLVFHLNEDNEITGYVQTMLDSIEPLRDKEEVLPAFKAIENLHQKGMLKPDSKITQIGLGYYTLVYLGESKESQVSQVLTPTWHFVVERKSEKENLLVNAFEGQIIQTNNEIDLQVKNGKEIDLEQ